MSEEDKVTEEIKTLLEQPIERLMVSVDLEALGEVLRAFIGEHHLISELKVTMGFPDNPVTRLIGQFNEHVEKLTHEQDANEKI